MVAERVVRYRIEAVVDPNAARLLERLAREQVDASDRVRRKRKADADQSTRDADAAAKEAERINARMAKEIANENARAITTLRRMRADAAREAERQSRAVADAQIKATRAATAEIERQQAIVARAARAGAEGFKQITTGAMQLARAMVLLGVANEDDLELWVRRLAQMQAVFDVFRGTIDLVQGSIKVWQAYRAAVLAAAAAEAVAGRVSMARGGASAAGGVGQAIGGGAAAAGGGGALLTAAAPMAAFAAVAAAVTAALVGLLYVLDIGPWRDGIDQMLGQFDYAGTAAGKLATAQLKALDATEKAIDRDREDRQVARAGQSRLDEAALLRAGVAGGPGDLAAIDAARASARATIDAERARQASLPDAGLNGLDFGRQIQDSLGKESDAAERLIDLERKRLAIVEETGRARVAAINEELTKLEQARAVEASRVEAARSNLEGAAERFGQMSPEERSRALQTFRKFQAGGELSAGERNTLRSIGFADEARAGDVSAARRGGFGEIEAALQGKVATAEAALAKVELDIKASTELKMTLETDAKAMADQVATELAGLLESVVEQASRRLAEERRQIDLRDTTRRVATEVAETGQQ